MPFKDREKRREYDREYQQAHQVKLAAYRRKYRQDNREEIAENEKRKIRIGSHYTSMYLGVSGMTRKQRLKFQEELNGAIKRP